MIKVKHFLDPAEKDDGQRIWVEPCGLVKDMRTWCKVDHVLPHLGPPQALADWLEEHPDGYEYFRARYHECLERSPYKPALQHLACAAAREPVTLLHHSDNTEHNTATALYEFLSELEAWCPPE